MKRVRIATDGEQPGAFCPVCGRRLGDAYGPSADGLYAMSVDAKWHRVDGRTLRRSRDRGRRSQRPMGVQSTDVIECQCGELLAAPDAPSQ